MPHRGQIKNSKVVAKAIGNIVEIFDCGYIDNCKLCGLSVKREARDGNEDHDLWECISDTIERNEMERE